MIEIMDVVGAVIGVGWAVVALAVVVAAVVIHRPTEKEGDER